jgi:serine/threonine protein kinase
LLGTRNQLDHGNLAGKYRLLATLGHGGMADVYLAAAPGPAGFNKLLVVKELRPALARDPDFLDMFLDEARLAARLSHPNVVQTYETSGSDGRYFITMEYLDGQPLNRIFAEFAKQGGLSWSAGLRIVSEALAGLHYAHELRDYSGEKLEIVHRDVTPHNLFVTYDGQVKLVDFGIAKAADSSAETRIGMLKGKVGYMAPEQARGDAVDRRTDVYGMGVVLWELLARRRMWRATPDVVILSRLAADDLPALASMASDVPPELERICARATAAKPEERFASAEQFRHEIEAYLREQGELLEPRAVGALIAETFAGERERMRIVIQLQLMDASRLPAVLEHTYTSRSGSLDPRASSRGAVAITPTPPLIATPSLRPASPSLRPSALLERAVSTQDQATAVFPQSGPPVHRRGRWIALAAVAGGLTASLLVVAGRPRFERAQAATRASGTPTRAAPQGPPQQKPRLEISGDIEQDSTLGEDNEYLLKFTTYVKPGVTLTIRPGTRVVGDRATRGTLVVLPGARLVARGTPSAPIVFTSERPSGQARAGDWGGVLLLGKAPINLRDEHGQPMRGRVEGIASSLEYGGSEPDDDSGVLSYVRIEYSGVEIAPANEINGLTLAGVGRGTQLDHIQVRHTADDCFEFFGGTVNGQYLICQHPGDDGFDWDLGYTGKLQFLFLKEDPEQDADSNGFEGDNDPNSSLNQPVSSPTIFNATLCGPGRELPHEHYGALIRRQTRGSISNAIFMGFGAGLDVRDVGTALELRSSIFFGNVTQNLAFAEQPGGQATLQDDDNGFDERRFLLDPARKNSTADPHVLGCASASTGPFGPERSLTFGAALPPRDGFFDPRAAYIGAFRDRNDDWAEAGWVSWD